MSFSPTRRRLLKAAPAVAVAPYIAACGSGEELPLPPGVPIGPFDKNSTAEDVTAGLDLSGKTALVTGCNSGIGHETMRVRRAPPKKPRPHVRASTAAQRRWWSN
jgi:hypothetical protein